MKQRVGRRSLHVAVGVGLVTAVIVLVVVFRGEPEAITVGARRAERPAVEDTPSGVQAAVDEWAVAGDVSRLEPDGSAMRDLAGDVPRASEGITDPVPAVAADTSARLAGTVLTDDGDPAVGAEVVFLRPDGSSTEPAARTETDTAGRYELAFPERVRGRAQALWHPNDGLPAAVAHTPLLQVEPGQALTMDLRLPGCFLITGIVVDAAGVPIASARVGADSPGGPGATDVDGRFRLELREAGEHCVHVQVADRVQARPAPVLLTRERPAQDVVIKMLRGGRIAGRVTWDDGAPVVGATVSARPLLAEVEDPALPWAWRIGGQGETGADGRFSIAPLHPELPYLVTTAGEPDTGSLRRTVVARTGDLAVWFVFERDRPRELVIVGTVVEAGTGRSIADVAHACGPWLDGYPPSAWYGGSADGQIFVGGLRPGDYGLAISAPGYESRVLGPLELVDEALELLVELEPLEPQPGADDPRR